MHDQRTQTVIKLYLIEGDREGIRETKRKREKQKQTDRHSDKRKQAANREMNKTKVAMITIGPDQHSLLHV